MARSLRRLLLSIVFLTVAVAVYVFFGFYLLMGLVVLNLACWMLVPIARKRRWGSEGRLTRYLSRPRIKDATRVSQQPRARFD